MQSVIRNMQSIASQSRELSNVLTGHLAILSKLDEKNEDMVKVARKDIEMTRRQLIDTEKVCT